MDKNVIIIFARNLILGQVKTRLAQKIGDENALKIYTFLLQYTLKTVAKIKGKKIVYFSDHEEKSLAINKNHFKWSIQKGADLGEKMQNAFHDAFSHGYRRVVLIGTDCLALKTHHIESAFHQLESKNVVLGPSEDGGYYLIGLNAPRPQLFKDKEYSHGQVFEEVMEEIKRNNLTYSLLEKLNDIDELEDLKDTIFDNPRRLPYRI